MRHRLIGATLLLALTAALVPTALNAQGKKGKALPPLDSAKLQPGEFTGTVKTTTGSDRTFVATIESLNIVYTGKGLKAYTGNNQAIKQLVKLQNQLVQAQNNYVKVTSGKRPKAAQVNQAANKVQQLSIQLQNQAMVVQLQLIAQASAVTPEGLPPGYKLVKSVRDVEFQHTEAVKVRTMFLPEEFDDKGEVKKYSAAEKLKLKGKDKGLPGYESSIEKLEVGQKIKVKLVRRPKPKPAPVEKAEEKEPEKKVEKVKEKDKDKEKDEEPRPKGKATEDDGEKKLQVRLIIILEEGKGGESSPGEKGKRKK
jgi:hypothetical protein